MKIILVQAEIELAIRAYVLTQIAVKDGQDITIDFKNTRGDDGTTAEINITSPNMAPAPNEQPVQKPAQTATSGRQTAPVKQIPAQTSTAALAPAVAAGEATGSASEKSADSASTTSAQQTTEPQVSETSQSEAEESSGFPKATVPFDADDPVDGGNTPDVAETIQPVSKPSFLKPAAAATEAAPAASSGKSLFANLTKPVNPKPPAEG